MVGAVQVSYVYQAIVLLSGLWLARFLLARLGEHDYGLWSLGAQIIAWIALMDFGVVAILPRETAYVTGNPGAGADDLPKLVDRTTVLVLWQLPIVAFTAAVTWFLLPPEWEALGGPMLLVLATFVIGFPLRILQAVLQGLQDLVFVALQTFIIWLIGFAVTVVLVSRGWGLYGLAVGWVALQVCQFVSSWIRLRTRHPNVLPRRLTPLRWANARGLLTSGAWVSVSQIAQVLLAGSDLIIIGAILGPEATVPYGFTAKLALVLANQPQLIMQAALPGISEIRAGSDAQHVQRVATALGQAMLLVSGLVVCIVLVVNQAFIAWWLPEANPYGGDLLTGLLLLVMLLRHWNFTTVYTLFALGQERRISLTALADGLTTVVASIVLVKWLGLIGAPIGALVGVAAVSLPANLIGIARVTGVTVAARLKPLWGWTWRFGLLAVACVGLSRIDLPATLPSLVLATTLVGLLVLAVMSPVALREPLGTYVRPRLFRHRTP